MSVPTAKAYLDRPNRSQKVMLKVVKVPLHNGDRVMETYAMLDDGSERTIVLPQVVQQLHLTRQPEVLYLRTIQQKVVELHGASVNLHISPLHQPAKKYKGQPGLHC